MRTTVTLDDDVAALIETERREHGETFREALNRLVRRGGQRDPSATESPPPLPVFAGRPIMDISDISAVLTMLDEEDLREKGLYEHLGGHQPGDPGDDGGDRGAPEDQGLAD